MTLAEADSTFLRLIRRRFICCDETSGISFKLRLGPTADLRPHMKRLWLTASAGVIPVLATVAFIGGRQNPEGEEAVLQAVSDVAESQPIQFPHDVHAGQFLIDCQYCHFSAERSVDAGIPPVETCMGCHQVVTGRNNPEEVAKIRDYYESGTPIPWKRIYKVSDHVHFPHFRHVAAEISCQTCHGEVQSMNVLEDVAPEAGSLKMGWCVSCHLERGASRDCTVCHY